LLFAIEAGPYLIRLNCMYCKYFESQNIIAKKKQNVK
jgi:hypothetical protein